MLGKFTVEIGESCFTVIKVFEGKSYYIYVLPGEEGRKGFFMNMNTAGDWELANRILVADDYRKLEARLSGAIKEKMNIMT